MTNCAVDEAFWLGEWLVDVREGTIQSQLVKHQLEPKMMSVLVELARRQGQLLTRQQLHNLVWPGVEVTNDALTRCIYALRQRLGDSSRNPRYIATVSRRGYRLLMPVRPRSGSPRAIEPGSANQSIRQVVPGINPTMLTIGVVVLTYIVTFWTEIKYLNEFSVNEVYENRLAAEDYYDIGREYLFASSPEAVRKATELFQQAISLDRNYVDAYGGLADAYLGSISDAGVDYLEAVSQAEGVLTEAAKIDPSSSSLLPSQAYLAMFKGEYKVAKEKLEAAVQIKPFDTLAYVRLGDLEMGNGRYTSGLKWYQKAAELEPLKPEVVAKVIDAYCYLGMYDEAQTWLVSKLPLAEDPSPLFRSLSYLTSRQGLHDESINWALRALEIDDRDSENIMAAASSYINAMNFDKSTFWLNRLDMKHERNRRLKYRLLMARGSYEEIVTFASRQLEKSNCYCETDGAYLSYAQLALNQVHKAQENLERVLNVDKEKPVRLDASHYEHKIVLNTALAASYLQQRNMESAENVLLKVNKLIDFAEENGLTQAVVSYERWVVKSLMLNSGFIQEPDVKYIQESRKYDVRGAEDPRLRQFPVSG